MHQSDAPGRSRRHGARRGHHGPFGITTGSAGSAARGAGPVRVYGFPMADSEPGHEVARSELRASHEDRDRVVELLRVSAGDGRLTAEELDERLELAMTARTYGELAELVADLPAAGSAWPARRRPGPRRSSASTPAAGTPNGRAGGWCRSGSRRGSAAAT